MGYGRHDRTWLIAMGITLVLGLAGCSTSKGPTTPGETPLSGLQECGGHDTFHRVNFPSPSVIDCPWFPLIPGTQMIFDGVSNLGSGFLPHRVVLTVTDLTKTIAGVSTLVVWDRDYSNGELHESELAFFAQDWQGNVWTIGEYPEEYQGGVFIGAPSTWITNVAGAEAGILVPGLPEVGDKFLQGFSPDINFLDCATVFQTGASVCVPLNCYEDVLVVEEWSPLDVGSGRQRKFYAGGIGVVQIAPVNDPEGERLVLENVLHLSPQALRDAGEEALKLERRAYQVSSAYRHTAPAHFPDQGP